MRRRAGVEQLPRWVADPVASDYLTAEQIAGDELWPWHALAAFQAALDAWAEPLGVDLVGLNLLQYPRADLPVTEDGPE